MYDMYDKGTPRGNIDPGWVNLGDVFGTLPADGTADRAWWNFATEIPGNVEPSVSPYGELRVVCELAVRPPLALVKGYKGSARWMSWVFSHSGNRRWGLSGRHRFYVDANDTQMRSRTWYRWRDLKRIDKEALAPRRLPGAK